MFVLLKIFSVSDFHFRLKTQIELFVDAVKLFLVNIIRVYFIFRCCFEP